MVQSVPLKTQPFQMSINCWNSQACSNFALQSMVHAVHMSEIEKTLENGARDRKQLASLVSA
jgi:hypothetical protein